jgi:hypothetical protein
MKTQSYQEKKIKKGEKKMYKKIIYLIMLMIGLNACAGRSSQHLPTNSAQQTGETVKNKEDADQGGDQDNSNNKTSEIYLNGEVSILWQNHAHDIGATYALNTTTTGPELPTNLDQMKEFKPEGTITSIPVILNIATNNTTEEIAYYTVKQGEDLYLYSTKDNQDTGLLKALKTDPMIHSTQLALFEFDTTPYIVVPGKDKAVIVNLKTKETTKLGYQGDTGQRIFVDDTGTNTKTLYVQGKTHFQKFTIEKKQEIENNANQGASIGSITKNEEFKFNKKEVSINTASQSFSKKLLPIIKANNSLYFEAGNNSTCKTPLTALTVIECKTAPDKGIIGNLIAKENEVYISIITPRYFVPPGETTDWFNSEINDETDSTNLADYLQNNTIQNFLLYFKIYAGLFTNKIIDESIKTYSTKIQNFEGTEITYPLSVQNDNNALYLGNTHHTALLVDDKNLYFATNIGFSSKQTAAEAGKEKTYGYKISDNNNGYGLESNNNNQPFINYKNFNMETKESTDPAAPFNPTSIDKYAKLFKYSLKHGSNTQIDWYDIRDIHIAKTVDFAFKDTQSTVAIMSYRKDLKALYFTHNFNLTETSQPWILKQQGNQRHIDQFLTIGTSICINNTCNDDTISAEETINGLSVGNGTVYIVTKDTLYTTN